MATAASADPSASLPGFVRYLQIFVLVPAAVLLLLRDTGDFRVLCGAFVLLALVQGAVGVVQNVTGTGASYMGQNIRAVGTFGALDVMGMSTVVVVRRGGGLRARLAAPARARGGSGRRPVLCARRCCVPLALSFSRGAWIATAAACTAVLLLAGAARALVGVVALAAAVVVLVGGLGVGSAMVAGAADQHHRGHLRARPVGHRPLQHLGGGRPSIWQRATLRRASGSKGFPAHRDGHASLGLSSGSDTAGAGMRSSGSRCSRRTTCICWCSASRASSGAGVRGRRCCAGGVRPSTADSARRPPARPVPADGAGAADCGLVAVGLVVWQAVDFLYADIGGPSTVLTSVVLGAVAWWALAPTPTADDEAPGR